MLKKVRDTRLAPEPILPDPNLGWSYGLNHAWFMELNEYWQEEWNWEDVQKEINKCVTTLLTGSGKLSEEGWGDGASSPALHSAFFPPCWDRS